MKGNPARPGGSLTSKPTWSNASRCSSTSVFFVCGVRDQSSSRVRSAIDVLTRRGRTWPPSSLRKEKRTHVNSQQARGITAPSQGRRPPRGRLASHLEAAHHYKLGETEAAKKHAEAATHSELAHKHSANLHEQSNE